MKDILIALTPAASEAAGVLGVLILGFLAERLGKAIGVQIEEKHRLALHQAISTGVQAAVARGLGQGALVDVALEHTRQSVPQALRRLAPSEDVLKSLILSKLSATKR